MLEKAESMNSDIACLQEAMQRFNSTGYALQERYRELKEETVRLRELLAQKEAEVKRNERLAMLGKTAAAIAHEIRNPLGAIKLFLSMLQDDNSDNPDSLKIIDQINTSVDRLDTTVGNILQFARERKLEFAPVNIHSLIREQVEHFSIVHPSIRTEVELKGLPFVNGNEEALRRVFENLLRNAAQAMKKEGAVSIRTFEDPRGGITTLVRDSGPGIDESIRENLFEPFVTTKGAGTGLGLAIVRQIILQHGGEISVESKDGAEFSVYIPRMAAQPRGEKEIT